MSPDSDPEYWDFSFEEFGRYDMTAAVRHILNVNDNGDDKLSLIAFSEGTSSAFYALSMDFPESQYLTDHLNLFVSMGTVTEMRYADEPVLEAIASS